jgi:ParB family chromosome partitioning protein
MPKITGLGRGLSSLIPNKKIFAVNVGVATMEKSETLSESSQGVAMAETVCEVDISLIRPNPRQPRKNFDESEMEELVNSIKTHGILQPILVSKQDGYYEIIAGERRFRAAKKLEMKTVPVMVREVEDTEKLELALIENIQRQNLNPIEEALAYQELISNFQLTQDEVAVRVGKSRPKITNTLRLLHLPQVIQEALRSNIISEGHAKVIAGLEREADQLMLFRRVVDFKLPVRLVEEQASGMVRRQAKLLPPREPWLLEKETLLRNALGTKVNIQFAGSTGKVTIDFYTREDLEELVLSIVGK